MRLHELVDDYVIVEGPVYRPRSGKDKYRFTVRIKDKLYSSLYRYKTAENARAAGEKHLKGINA